MHYVRACINHIFIIQRTVLNATMHKSPVPLRCANANGGPAVFIIIRTMLSGRRSVMEIAISNVVKEYQQQQNIAEIKDSNPK